MPDPEQHLDVYLVGGAVRDQLMGLDVKDRDWVVVGASPEKMIDLGFRPIGRDFPVFLHPHTSEEYALARTERKVSPGYHGFEFHSSPDVTLEQDLSRRDLTMNAIARDRSGNLVDPYNGAADIEAKTIRHVSEAFREDPVRILRVARFCARFHDRGFSVATSTRELMIRMVNDGEVDALVPERVWQELESAMSAASFSSFICELRTCGALQRILPEVDALFGVPQVAKYHPEIDTGLHTLMSLDAASRAGNDTLVVFGVLVHDLGKALTPKHDLPRHRNHEMRGLEPIRALCARLGVPGRYRDFALRVCEFHLHGHRIKELKPSTVLKLLEQLDGFRNPHQVARFAESCLADKRGRTGHESDSGEIVDILRAYHEAAMAVDGGEIARSVAATGTAGNKQGAIIQKRLGEARCAAIAEVKQGLSNQG